MATYRAITHFHLKKGKEKDFLKLINELTQSARDCGCKDIEIMMDENNPLNVVTSGVYDHIEGAKKYKPIFESKLQQLNECCVSPPKREVFKIQSTTAAKVKKAA